MSRQINLYSLAFRRQRKPFTAAWTVAAAIAVAAAMAADYAFEAHQLRALREQQSATEGQIRQLRDQILALGKGGAKTADKALEEQVVRAERLLRGRQELVERLKSGQFGNREGYAAFLTALARRRVDGVWLTRIDISGPDSDFTIEGRTVRADLVPAYIKSLGKERVLSGKAIDTLAMREREVEPAGAPTVPLAPAASPPARAADAAAAGPRAGPVRVRVVDFTIGTAEGATQRGAAAAGGAGR